MNAEDVIYPTCPGCMGTVKPDGGSDAMGICERCHGFVSLQPIPRWLALNYVYLYAGAMHEGDVTADDLVYFNLDIAGTGRTHGWMHRESRKVVQYG